MTATETTAARMRRAGITADGWPYGPNIDADSRRALLDWTDATGYKLATPRARCLHWLVGQARRCSALQDTRHDGALLNDLLRVLDHPTFWTRDGKPALILAQPYTYPPAGWAEVVTEKWPVSVEVTESGPWYGAGTHGVFITPRLVEETR